MSFPDEIGIVTFMFPAAADLQSIAA